MNLPTYSQIVICGGGIAGASVAYHLAKLGLRDITLLERHQLTSGTTWHAAGLIMQLRSTHALTELAKYNVELYSKLESETGQSPGFRQNGTLGVCRTSDRILEAKKTASIAKSFGIEAHMITPCESKEIYPPLDPTAIQGAIYIPNDGQTNPVDTTMALIAGARQHGATIVESCEVKALKRIRTQEYLIETLHGEIRCETLVLACGLWTRELAAQLGIRVPLYACEHYYIVTEPLDCVLPNLPVLRDTDGCSYIKEDAGKWLVGAFQPDGKPLEMSEIPADTPFVELPENWDEFELPFSKATEILPALHNAGIAKFLNGPESFTPDLLFALGEVPEMPNCYISAGYNSEGIELNPGAGRALAEWIAHGEPSIDLGFVNINRFHSFQNNTNYLRKRSSEVLGLHYKMHWPHLQKESARNIRKSVLHDRWVMLNASFGEAVGWERPMWFAPKESESKNIYSHTRPNWFEYTALECKAAREKAIILDQSSFGKFLIQGSNACEFLQGICSGKIDVEMGRIVYTHMLNSRGGIEVDLTVNRLDEDRFMIVSSATSQPRDHAWVAKNIATNSRATLTDVTSCYTVLSIQGPNSRDVLSSVSNADFSNEAFPLATSKTIEVGYAHAIANRLTFIGELGWELYIESEFAQDIFDRIMDAGSDFGLKPAGYHALEHLRCEKAYREFDLDLTPEDTPFEAGLGYTVDLDKPGDFTGRDSLLSQTEFGLLKKRLVMFKLNDPEPVLYGEEPIWLNGKIAGYLSSGAFSFTLGTSVGMGYVRQADGITDDLTANGRWEIEIACERFAAVASLRTFLDPSRERVHR